MSMLTMNFRGLGLLAALALAGSVGACKTVSPDDMDASLADLRADMQDEIAAGDERVASELNNRVDAVERRLAQLEQDLQQMERDFEVSIQRLEDQLRFNVPVYFAFDEATLQDGAHQVLDRFGGVAADYYPQAQITVEGFTDPAGPEQYNIWLGEQRATAVAEYLLANTALVTERVRTVSYGEDTRRLISDGWGPGTEGWENRRVVLVIDHNGQAPRMTSSTEGESGS